MRPRATLVAEYKLGSGFSQQLKIRLYLCVKAVYSERVRFEGPCLPPNLSLKFDVRSALLRMSSLDSFIIPQGTFGHAVRVFDDVGHWMRNASG